MKSKGVLAILLILNTLVWKSYQSEEVTCCKDCISGLRSDPDARIEEGEAPLPVVKIFEVPSADNINQEKVCGKFWLANGGTCCSQDTLELRATAWKARLFDRFFKLKDGIANYKKVATKAGKIKEYVERSRSSFEGKINQLPEDKLNFKPRNNPIIGGDKMVCPEGTVLGNQGSTVTGVVSSNVVMCIPISNSLRENFCPDGTYPMINDTIKIEGATKVFECIVKDKLPSDYDLSSNQCDPQFLPIEQKKKDAEEPSRFACIEGAISVVPTVPTDPTAPTENEDPCPVGISYSEIMPLVATGGPTTVCLQQKSRLFRGR